MSNYFEGWYFKHQKAQEMLAVIAGRADDGAFIQVLTREGSYYAGYPLSAYRKRNDLQLADSVFAPDGISLAMRHDGIELTGNLRYAHLTPIRGDIMGPFRFFPMQCRHKVISMHHRLAGSVFLNGTEMEFTGGKGYIEGDAGCSFPQSYTWVQCNDFEKDCSIMASAAQIPFAGRQIWGCICVICLDGVEYRLATYLGARILCRDARQLVLAQGDLILRVMFFKPHAGHLLAAPVAGKMGRRIMETPCAPASFTFSKGNRILLREKSMFASYEYVV